MLKAFHGRIDDTADALIIFEACRQGVVPRITRRLQAAERGQAPGDRNSAASESTSESTIPSSPLQAGSSSASISSARASSSISSRPVVTNMIVPGSVFVFDELESGISRWTDGRIWSPSRISGNFLVYRELYRKLPNLKCMNAKDKQSMKDGSGIKDQALKDAVKENDLVVLGCMKGTFVLKKNGMVKKTICLKGINTPMPPLTTNEASSDHVSTSATTAAASSSVHDTRRSSRRQLGTSRQLATPGTQHLICYERAGEMDDLHRPRDYMELLHLPISRRFIEMQKFRNPPRILDLKHGERPIDPYDQYVHSTRVVEDGPARRAQTADSTSNEDDETNSDSSQDYHDFKNRKRRRISKPSSGRKKQRTKGRTFPTKSDSRMRKGARESSEKSVTLYRSRRSGERSTRSSTKAELAAQDTSIAYPSTSTHQSFVRLDSSQNDRALVIRGRKNEMGNWQVVPSTSETGYSQGAQLSDPSNQHSNRQRPLEPGTLEMLEELASKHQETGRARFKEGQVPTWRPDDDFEITAHGDIGDDRPLWQSKGKGKAIGYSKREGEDYDYPYDNDIDSHRLRGGVAKSKCELNPTACDSSSYCSESLSTSTRSSELSVDDDGQSELTEGAFAVVRHSSPRAAMEPQTLSELSRISPSSISSQYSLSGTPEQEPKLPAIPAQMPEMQAQGFSRLGYPNAGPENSQVFIPQDLLTDCPSHRGDHSLAHPAYQPEMPPDDPCVINPIQRYSNPALGAIQNLGGTSLLPNAPLSPDSLRQSSNIQSHQWSNFRQFELGAPPPLTEIHQRFTDMTSGLSQGHAHESEQLPSVQETNYGCRASFHVTPYDDTSNLIARTNNTDRGPLNRETRVATYQVGFAQTNLSSGMTPLPPMQDIVGMTMQERADAYNDIVSHNFQNRLPLTPANQEPKPMLQGDRQSSYGDILYNSSPVAGSTDIKVEAEIRHEGNGSTDTRMPSFAPYSGYFPSQSGMEESVAVHFQSVPPHPMQRWHAPLTDSAAHPGIAPHTSSVLYQTYSHSPMHVQVHQPEEPIDSGQSMSLSHQAAPSWEHSWRIATTEANNGSFASNPRNADLDDLRGARDSYPFTPGASESHLQVIEPGSSSIFYGGPLSHQPQDPMIQGRASSAEVMLATTHASNDEGMPYQAYCPHNGNRSLEQVVESQEPARYLAWSDTPHYMSDPPPSDLPGADFNVSQRQAPTELSVESDVLRAQQMHGQTSIPQHFKMENNPSSPGPPNMSHNDSALTSSISILSSTQSDLAIFPATSNNNTESDVNLDTEGIDADIVESESSSPWMGNVAVRRQASGSTDRSFNSESSTLSQPQRV